MTNIQTEAAHTLNVRIYAIYRYLHVPCSQKVLHNYETTSSQRHLIDCFIFYLQKYSDIIITYFCPLKTNLLYLFSLIDTFLFFFLLYNLFTSFVLLPPPPLLCFPLPSSLCPFYPSIFSSLSFSIFLPSLLFSPPYPRSFSFFVSVLSLLRSLLFLLFLLAFSTSPPWLSFYSFFPFWASLLPLLGFPPFPPSFSSFPSFVSLLLLLLQFHSLLPFLCFPPSNSLLL